jgi:hypothetical protein
MSMNRNILHETYEEGIVDESENDASLPHDGRRSGFRALHAHRHAHLPAHPKDGMQQKKERTRQHMYEVKAKAGRISGISHGLPYKVSSEQRDHKSKERDEMVAPVQ